MTEAEAETKWCPFARVAGPMQSQAEGTSYNRWPGSDGTTAAMLTENRITLCIGSACMAWRWSEHYQVNAEGRAFTHDRVADDKTGPLNTVEPGYCGLAGKP